MKMQVLVGLPLSGGGVAGETLCLHPLLTWGQPQVLQHHRVCDSPVQGLEGGFTQHLPRELPLPSGAYTTETEYDP